MLWVFFYGLRPDLHTLECRRIALTLPVLGLLSSKAQGCKVFWKASKPCCVGIHWIVLLSTLRWVPVCHGFSHFSGFLHHFVLAKYRWFSIILFMPCALEESSLSIGRAKVQGLRFICVGGGVMRWCYIGNGCPSVAAYMCNTTVTRTRTYLTLPTCWLFTLQ